MLTSIGYQTHPDLVELLCLSQPLPLLDNPLLALEVKYNMSPIYMKITIVQASLPLPHPKQYNCE